MTKQDAIQVFEDRKVRTVWDDEQQKWLISVIDVIEVLTGNDRPRKYWNDLKSKLKKEGSQLSDFIGQLKMRAEDGKLCLMSENSAYALNSLMNLPISPIPFLVA